MARAPGRAVAPCFLALLLILAGLVLPTGSASSGPTPVGAVTTGPDSSAGPRSAAPGASSAVPLPSVCADASANASSLWGGPWPSPTVSPAAQSGCPTGADESSLSFLSNRSGAGERASFTVVLPPAAADTGRTFADASIRMWTSGVLCSRDGATQVVVQLIPPTSPYRSNYSANWSVRAPAYDLAPPSACDPTCTNDTA
ncbi:MAG: hypothetical protein L3K06_08810, partial [Thermoplasmata archaeon]|nr:hypothetical protein [Thermoplasmata archaeon]